MDYSTKLGYMIGSALHEDWRKKNAYRKTRFKKAGNNMKGEKITSVPENVPSRINEDGTLEIDILNTKFDDLTPAWKQENLDAGMFIAKLVTLENDFDIENLELFSLQRTTEAQRKVDLLASKIHDAWMERPNNAWAKVSEMEEIKMQLEEPAKWDEYQFKPYEELSERNKELDIDQLRVFAKLIYTFGSIDSIVASCPVLQEDALLQTKRAAEMYKNIDGISFCIKQL